ncbi:MAG TPA: 5-oxoprolinase subunit PxpA [Opitutaceae bacterium]|nr:5-oxoprolinase subunit PxpA [Opitutaceae bacterium]
MSGAAFIDLNADVGEGSGSDAELVPLVTSVNIACGAHAGDPATMRRTVALALSHGVAIGAHPGFGDRVNFGRREVALEPGAAGALVVGQVAELVAIAAPLGARVGHVKLHGALYNMAARDGALAAEIAGALAGAMRAGGADWALVGPAGSKLLSAGRERGLRVRSEAFADRSYGSDGMLRPRSEAGSVIADAAAAVRQALRIASEGIVTASDGTEVPIAADTLCIHGDSPGAAEFARQIRAALAAAGIAVRC